MISATFNKLVKNYYTWRAKGNVEYVNWPAQGKLTVTADTAILPQMNGKLSNMKLPPDLGDH